MHDQDRPTGVSVGDREEFASAARAAAWSVGTECPNCQGSDIVPGERKVIHALSPLGIIGSADWSLDEVLNAIQHSPKVRWVESKHGHDLVIEINDNDYRFQVSRPTEAVTA